MKELKIVDIEFLDSFTNGDKSMEKMLLDIFFKTCDETIDLLTDKCSDDADEDWRRSAHNMKGGSANLGAKKLSNSCFEAEKNFEKNNEEKQKLIENIKTEYDNVKKFIKENKPYYEIPV